MKFYYEKNFPFGRKRLKGTETAFLFWGKLGKLKLTLKNNIFILLKTALKAEK